MKSTDDSSNRQKINGCFSQQISTQNVDWFLSQNMKMLARRERSQQKEDTFLLKRILYIFSITLRLRDRHIFCMEKPLEILNVFFVLILKQLFWKRKTFVNKLERRFFRWLHKHEKRIALEQNCHAKTNVKTNKMESTNGPMTKNGFLPLTTLFFWRFNFSIRTSYKQLI